jgi:hypothetical protein
MSNYDGLAVTGFNDPNQGPYTPICSGERKETVSFLLHRLAHVIAQQLTFVSFVAWTMVFAVVIGLILYYAAKIL